MAMEKPPFQFSLGQLLSAMPLFCVAAWTYSNWLKAPHGLGNGMFVVAALVSFGAGVVILARNSVRGTAIALFVVVFFLAAALLG